MRSIGLADAAARQLEARAHTADELARMLVSLDGAMRAAAQSHAWAEAADLEDLRDHVCYLRMQLLRNNWQPARGADSSARA